MSHRSAWCTKSNSGEQLLRLKTMDMKKKWKTCSICLFVTMLLSYVTAFAQEKGIHFEPVTERWGEVLKKAKAEHKDIFVDCYATWCAPCKAMDHDIYTNEKVGEF